MSLTVAAIRKRKPKSSRVEIPDGNGLRLVIQPSGAKSWAVRYRAPDGRPVKLTLGTVDETGQELKGEPAIGGHLTLAAARLLTAEVHRLRALGRDPVAEKKATKLQHKHQIIDSGEATFPNAVKFYIENGRRKRVRKGILKDRGWRDTAQVLGLHYPDSGEPEVIQGGLCERWADKPVAEITPEDVEVLVEEARNKGIPGRPRRNRGASDVRAREMAGTLNAMFNWLLPKKRTTASGKRSHWIAVNPALSVDKPHAPLARSRVLNTDPNKRRADELRWFWKAADQLGEPFSAMLKVMLLTGQRRSEVADMAIEELSDDRNEWTIPASRTKNGREHTVPLSTTVRDQLVKVIGERASGYVFTTTGGRAPVSGFSKLKRKLDAKMLAAAQEDDAKAVITPWRLHDLRRTFITGANEIGCEPHIIEAIANHSLPGVAGVYNLAKYLPQRLATLEQWGQHVRGVVSEQPDKKVLPMKRRNAS
jgi:integrase